MAPKCKLSYFALMGLSEPIRFLLSYGKMDFEDIRYEFEQWPPVKTSTPYGKLPVLEIDGKKMHQSTAICRYLGKKLGLAGENDWESAEIDMAVDTITDLRLKLSDYYWEPDEAIKQKKKETVFKETLPFYLERLNEQVKENGGYLAAGKMTWGDIFFAALCDYMNGVAQFDITKDYPNLASLKKKIRELPAIKEWISKRPVTNI
ncbi:glutathione S-transferase-like [Schistocerca gregaria]|uniref:glutathione transferase n=1 Tax=Schistocerca gregaria TaxID=7010 RepID=G9C5D7_SCHGR|nr:glutathione S-transferase-like [Schistocerca gregaria]XP_049856600.1 glutathione S-transferase-like [Schistocerca gregaria]AEV89756.1 Glutathione S-transferase [Schistocerca gregaria]